MSDQGKHLKVTGLRGNPIRVVLSDGREATITQKLIDAFATPSPFDHESVVIHKSRSVGQSAADLRSVPPSPIDQKAVGEPVAEIVAASTPAAEVLYGRDIRFFEALREVPIGTKLYAGATPLPGSGGRPAGHCDDDKAWQQFSADYANRSRADLGKGDLTDFALANAQFMCDCNSLDLILYQTAAKERIRWLSIQLAAALAASEGSK